MSITSTLPPQARRSARIAIVLASSLLGGLLGFHAPDESDVFWHLALGRAVLRAGARTVPEPYAIGAIGEPKVVPEWLWGVLNYALHQLGGFSALSALSLLLGAALGLAAGLWADRLCAERTVAHGSQLGWPSQLLLTSLVMTVLAARLRLRPEVLALSLLIAFLLLARGLFLGPPTTQLRRGAGLVALCLLWSQVHGSAVLAPVLLLLSLNAAAFAPAHRTRLLGLFALVLVAVLSCAHGLNLTAYIGDHAAGDAAAHILDMSPGDWSSLQPANSPFGLAMTLLALSWCGALALAPFRLGDALLAVLGVALYLTATRFGSMMAALGLPLAASFLHALKEARKLRFGSAAAPRWLAAGLVSVGTIANGAWLLREFDRVRPLFVAGLETSKFPLRAARVLNRPGEITRVHSAITAGAVLGFLGDGALEVSIDSRIPLHFDDADFGTYRDANRTPALLARYFRRFAIDAAVVQRDSLECLALKQHMRLVTVDANYATFRPGFGSALPGIDGCSTDHIERGCRDPEALARSVRLLREQRDDVYAAWLDTIAELECKRSTPLAAFRALPEPAKLPAIRAAVVRWRVRALARAGQSAAALEELRRELTAFDTRAISVLSEIWDPAHAHDALLALYRRGVGQMDDATPAAERGKLALLCMADADFDCAYFHALRAALAGDVVALHVLQQLAKHPPSEHARRSIEAWLPLLREPLSR